MSHDTAKLIGSLPPAEAGRDAIHVAVVPVVAGESLAPGQRVSLNGDGEATGRGKTVGVVDPYLTTRVLTGQRFWMFLPPGSITSLCHVWTHPAFPDAQAALVTPPPTEDGAVVMSRKWLEGFAPQFGLSYERLLEAAKAYLDSGEYIVQYDAEDWREAFYNNDTDFWRHYEIVTGSKVSEEDRGSFFSCSC